MDNTSFDFVLMGLIKRYPSIREGSIITFCDLPRGAEEAFIVSPGRGHKFITPVVNISIEPSVNHASWIDVTLTVMGDVPRGFMLKAYRLIYRQTKFGDAERAYINTYSKE